MLFATVDQCWIFLVMLAAGAAVGVLWDALALLRRLLEAGFFLSLIADILLGLGSAAILIIAMVQANYGQPRAYMFVAAGLGAALYGIAVARPLHAILRALRRGLGRMAARLRENRIIKVIFR